MGDTLTKDAPCCGTALSPSYLPTETVWECDCGETEVVRPPRETLTKEERAAAGLYVRSCENTPPLEFPTALLKGALATCDALEARAEKAEAGRDDLRAELAEVTRERDEAAQSYSLGPWSDEDDDE